MSLVSLRPRELHSFISPNYLAISNRQTAGEAVQLLRVRVKSFKDRSSYLYVTDEEKRLLGVLQMQDLLVSDPGVLVSALMKRAVVFISETASCEEAVEMFRASSFFMVPVVDQIIGSWELSTGGKFLLS